MSLMAYSSICAFCNVHVLHTHTRTHTNTHAHAHTEHSFHLPASQALVSLPLQEERGRPNVSELGALHRVRQLGVSVELVARRFQNLQRFLPLLNGHVGLCKQVAQAGAPREVRGGEEGVYCSAMLSAGVKERRVSGEVAGISLGERESFVGPEDGRVVQLLAGVELRLRASLL